MLPYERWITNLRLAWMGDNGKAIFGAFAAALGDRSWVWARQANLEHMPEKANDPASLPLIGSERQIFRGFPETETHYRTRLTKAFDQWARAGTPLGLLLALYYEGYGYAVIVQQNGRYYRLVLDENGNIDEDEPENSLEVGDLGELETSLTSSVTPGYTVPAGRSWWTFDHDLEFCSRFAVLLPMQPLWWMHFGVATFTNSATATVEWSRAFDDTDYDAIIGAPITTSGFPSIVLDSDSQTTTGATLIASGAFTGTVGVVAYADGENPFINPTDEILDRLERTIRLWSPAKATCMGAFALIYGRYWGWPLHTWGEGTWCGQVIKYLEP